MSPTDALRRAYHWFWGLVAVAIVLTGALSVELGRPSEPLDGVAVAVTGTLLLLVVTQACRVMLAISRAAPARQAHRLGSRPRKDR